MEEVVSSLGVVQGEDQKEALAWREQPFQEVEGEDQEVRVEVEVEASVKFLEVIFQDVRFALKQALALLIDALEEVEVVASRLALPWLL